MNPPTEFDYESEDDSFEEIRCTRCGDVIDDEEMADLDRKRCYVCGATKGELQSYWDLDSDSDFDPDSNKENEK